MRFNRHRGHRGGRVLGFDHINNGLGNADMHLAPGKKNVIKASGVHFAIVVELSAAVANSVESKTPAHNSV